MAECILAEAIILDVNEQARPSTRLLSTVLLIVVGGLLVGSGWDSLAAEWKANWLLISVTRFPGISTLPERQLDDLPRCPLPVVRLRTQLDQSELDDLRPGVVQRLLALCGLALRASSWTA